MNGDKEASGDEDEEEAIFYDKAKSFFDNISCDATEQARGCGISVLLWGFEKLQLVFMETCSYGPVYRLIIIKYYCQGLPGCQSVVDF